jgi:primosomal protein N' (replication factor Y) (superfamily II helicase)
VKPVESPIEGTAAKALAPDAVQPFIEVAFNIPLDRLFTYRNLQDKPARIGCRVEATLGRRKAVGYVVNTVQIPAIPEEGIKPILRVLDPDPLFGPYTADLAAWISGMYLCSRGEALSAMLPSGKREPSGGTPPFEDYPPEGAPLVLSGEQKKALERILAEKSGRKYLYGTTGSGKTEVFLQAAEATLAEGRGVLYLVPEIALTKQVVEAVVRRFGDRCAVLHSGLTPSRRLAEWRRILRGEADVVVGARSAVFAPVAKLGLIVMDEEHEGSYKSGSSPRYHARQVAMKRCTDEGARLLMGSATPSAEAWHLMTTGGLERLDLTRRLAGGAPPVVEVVDMRAEEGALSHRLVEELRRVKAEGGQSILFLNRRGFSYFFRCRSCGAEIRCRNCSVGLTYHKDRNRLLCHYCGYSMAPPKACPECGSLDVGWSGFGTERIEEEIGQRFQDFNVARLDADVTARKGALDQILEDFRSGKIDILLGTQMVAKGLNFPGVKLVGIVLADTSLNLPDFRSAERTFSLIVQVAGRAGRFSPDGRVILQTFRPDSPVIRFAAAQDVMGFYASELVQREELGFPPYSRLIRVVIRSRILDRAWDAAHRFAEMAALRLPPDADILGPAECPISSMAGTYRLHIVVRSPAMGSIHRIIAEILRDFDPPADCRIEADVDPVSLM